MGSERALYASLRGLKIKSYQTSDLDQYLDFLDASNFGLAGGLIPYMEQLHDTGWKDRNGKQHSYKAASIRIKIDAAKRLGDYIIEHHEKQFTPEVLLRWEREKKKAKAPKSVKAMDEDKYILWPDVLALIEKTEDPKIRLIMAFLAQSACRCAEALSAKIDDMTRTGTHYRIRIVGKGDKERWVKVEIRIIEEILSVFGSTTWLFEHSGRPYNANSITTRIRDIGRVVLGKRISCHTFRHSWTTEQFRLGRPIDEISKYIGHACISVTADIYGHNSMSSENAMLTVFVEDPPEEMARDSVIAPTPAEEPVSDTVLSYLWGEKL